ncbi:MAG TPA: YraN family protein [Solirubrobacteraceae bacterium]|nr:YraN family protein [Solirubrobacteraceae bacterium]
MSRPPTSPPPCRASSQRRGGLSERSRETGRQGEDLAAAHFSRLGFTILARNLRSAQGEIDLIAADESVIAFVEVKTTRLKSRGANGMTQAPLERLSARQRHRLRGLALDWLRERAAGCPRAETIRFDAIGVVIDARGELLALEHVENAW